MAYINSMKEKISKTSSLTIQKAKGLSEITKLNNEVIKTEEQINELYRKIGAEVYQNYKSQPLSEVAELINLVSALYNNIDVYKMRIKEINNINSCSKCGAKISKEMKYCMNCGNKLLEQQMQSDESINALFCMNCGESVPDDSVYCTACGKKLK